MLVVVTVARSLALASWTVAVTMPVVKRSKALKSVTEIAESTDTATLPDVFNPLAANTVFTSFKFPVSSVIPVASTAVPVRRSSAIKFAALTVPEGTVIVMLSVAPVVKVNNSVRDSLLTISAVIGPVVSALIRFT